MLRILLVVPWWRNGRRGGLKILFLWSAGSSPAWGTNYKQSTFGTWIEFLFYSRYDCSIIFSIFKQGTRSQMSWNAVFSVSYYLSAIFGDLCTRSTHRKCLFRKSTLHHSSTSIRGTRVSSISPRISIYSCTLHYYKYTKSSIFWNCTSECYEKIFDKSGA